MVNKLTVSDNLPNLEKIEENSNKSSTQNQSLKNETTNENIFLAQKNKKNLKLNQNNAQNSDIQISQKSLSYSKIIQTVKSHFDKSFTVSKLFKNFILYSSFGLVVNVILSLHSTFLFVLPPFLIIFGICWLAKKKSFSILSWSFGSILLWSLPYWIGEFGRNFDNTKAIFRTLLQTSGSHTLAERFDRFWFSLLEIGKLSYFSSNMYLFSNIFLTVLLILTVLFWSKLESFLLRLLVVFWGIFVIIATNFWGILHTHYLVILWPVPCILTAILLHFFIQNSQFFQNLNSKKLKFKKVKFANLKNFLPKNETVLQNNSNSKIIESQNLETDSKNSQKFWAKKDISWQPNYTFLTLFLLFGTILSFQSNVVKVWEYSQSKFGNKRLTSTQDIVSILQFLLENSRLCASPEKQLSLKYLAEFVVIKRQKIFNLQECLDFETNSENGNKSQNLFDNNQTFIFWENWQGWQMTENIKSENIQKLIIIKQTGNI